MSAEQALQKELDIAGILRERRNLQESVADQEKIFAIRRQSVLAAAQKFADLHNPTAAAEVAAERKRLQEAHDELLARQAALRAHQEQYPDEADLRRRAEAEARAKALKKQQEVREAFEEALQPFRALPDALARAEEIYNNSGGAGIRIDLCFKLRQQVSIIQAILAGNA